MSNLIQQYNYLGEVVNTLQDAIIKFDITRSVIEKTSRCEVGKEMFLPITKIVSAFNYLYFLFLGDG